MRTTARNPLAVLASLTLVVVAILGLLVDVPGASGTPGLAQDAMDNVDDPVVLQRLGIEHIRANQPAEAIRYLLRATDYMPENGETHMWLGFAYFLNEEFELAEESYLRALSHNPDLTEVHNRMGVLKWKAGQHDVAIGEFEQALADPTYPRISKARVHTNMGNLYREQGNLDEALPHLRRAVELSNMPSDPIHALSHLSLAKVLNDLGRKEEALAALAETLSNEPNNVDALVTRGLVQRDLGRKEEACSTMGRVLELAPGSDLSEQALMVRSQLDC